MKRFGFRTVHGLNRDTGGRFNDQSRVIGRNEIDIKRQVLRECDTRELKFDRVFLYVAVAIGPREAGVHDRFKMNPRDGRTTPCREKRSYGAITA